MTGGLGYGKPRVLLVDMMSGANDYGRELALALAHEVDLTVVTVANTPLQNGDSLRVLPVFPAFGPVGGSRWQKLWQSVVAFYCLSRELIAHRAEVVHVQYFRYALLDMIFYGLARPFLRCLVFTAHNAVPHESRWWHGPVYRWWYGGVDSIHVLSQYARKQLVAYSGVDDRKIVVIPHGNYASLVSRTEYQSVGARSDFGVPDGHLVGLLFGLVREYKGIDLLIDAVAQLPEDLPMTFVVTGGGESELLARYRADAEIRGLSDRMRFVSRFYRDEELAGLLIMSDVVVFPYRHIYQSGALMLAMSYGCAIITSDIEGFQEYVTDGVDAVLCETTDPRAFASALQALADDADRRRNLAERSRVSSREKYGWDVIARSLRQLYLEKNK